ncbi:MAG: hypothetical protein HN733_08220, partial [Gammaproteobacteria bacterium]|nr:hypothetical protein [Gammaproteobacteria bacterium]
MKQGSFITFRLSFFLMFFVLFAPFSSLVGQEEDGSTEEIFWGDDEEEAIDFGEEFDFSDDEEGEGDFEDFEDEFSDEEFGDEEFGDEEIEDFSDDFADEPQESISAVSSRLGYTLNIIGSSPGFVNHQLRTYNSGMDFRAAFEFPM